MKKKNIYPDINLRKTGLLLKKKAKEFGYSVGDIQNFLDLACPQPVYRWYRGKMLPSVDHLYCLSKLYGVHMEDLLVIDDLDDKNDFILLSSDDGRIRLFL